MAYKVELPPFAKVRERKEDFQRLAYSSAAPDPSLGIIAIGENPETLVAPVATGDKNLGIPSPRFDLIINRSGSTSTAQITLNAWTIITNPQKFIETTLADLAAYLVARNQRRSHWASNLIDEKLEALKVCGIEAEIREIQ